MSSAVTFFDAGDVGSVVFRTEDGFEVSELRLSASSCFLLAIVSCEISVDYESMDVSTAFVQSKVSLHECGAYSFRPQPGKERVHSVAISQCGGPCMDLQRSLDLHVAPQVGGSSMLAISAQLLGPECCYAMNVYVRAITGAMSLRLLRFRAI